MGGMPAVEPVKESLVAAHGDSVPAEASKYQEDFSAQEFKEYCQRRVDLFLKYKQRQEEKVVPDAYFDCRSSIQV
jgi:hypothetical protein